jgi:hypothetical protein
VVLLYPRVGFEVGDIVLLDDREVSTMAKSSNQLQLGGMEELEAIKLSPTSLNLFTDCPRCFWLKFNKGIDRPSGIFPSLPGGMDGVLKVYFNEYRGQDMLPPIVEGKLPGRLMDPLPKTLLYKDKDLRAILTGKLDDALDLGDGRYSVMDHKTRGYPPKEDILAPYQLQMDAYDFLMEQNGLPTDHKAYLVYYYPTPGQLHNNFPFEVVAKEVAANPMRAKQVFGDAVALLRSDEMPEPARTCEYCGWAKRMEQLGD